MSYEEQEYLNSLTAERRERACRRAWMIDQAIRWGGWLLAGLILMANLVAVVH
jgi:hypothetical protein